MMSEKARRVARIVGFSHFVLHGAIVVITAFALVCMLWTGCQHGFGGEKLGSFEVDSAINLHSRYESKPVFLGAREMYTAGLFASFAFSIHQSYGAYLLLQASSLNAKPSDAFVNVKTHLNIQIAYLCVDYVVIISSIWFQPEALFYSPMMFLVALFMFRCVSILLVFWFRRELQTAADPRYCKICEKQKIAKGKAAEAFTISIP
ncbi:unnamed protein product [Orchesella dallaii]|uniref:Transmembrane protein n=1 Tax=Orchesella dallaii TaxID=48710 RepID=A0ABP1RUG4_9HEXA